MTILHYDSLSPAQDKAIFIKYPDSQFILRTSFSPLQAMVLSSFVPADSRGKPVPDSHRFPCSAVSGSVLFLLQNYFLGNFSA